MSTPGPDVRAQGADPLARRRVGSTAVEVTRLGLGTAPLGGWPAAVPEDQALATIRRAREVGLGYVDTAPFYGHGRSEAAVGRVLAEGGEAPTLSTKVGRVLVPGAPAESLFADPAPFTPVFDFSREGVLRSFEESCARLGLDRVDIVLIHDPDDHFEQARDEAFPVLAELRSEGKVGAIGVGMNWSGPLARFAEAADFDCFLLAGRYTLLEQDALDDLLPAVLERGMSVIAGGVYNSGLLADPRPGATYNYAPADPALLERAQRLAAVCAEHGVPLRAAALQLPLAHPAVATVVVGARTPDEVDDNLAMAATPIPAALWDDLRERGLLRADAPVPSAEQTRRT